MQSRKQRERTIDDIANAAYGLALIAFAYGWLTAGIGVGLLLGAGVIAMVLAGMYFWRSRRDTRLLAADLPALDRLSGEAFEEHVAVRFRGLGYRVKLTPNGADFGADLVLEKDGARTVVQAKRWKNDVGVKAVQEVVAAKAHYRAQHALVVTNSRFTTQAIQLARSNGVELWDRDRLARELSGEAVEAEANASPPNPVCPRCSAEMVERQGPRGRFWGCSRFPQCRGTVSA